MAHSSRKVGFVHSGDAISLSIRFGPSGPAYELSNDLTIHRGQADQGLHDTVLETQCCAIAEDERRYNTAHTLWYITLASDSKPRALRYNDVVVLRMAGTENFLTVKAELNKAQARRMFSLFYFSMILGIISSLLSHGMCYPLSNNLNLLSFTVHYHITIVVLSRPCPWTH